MASGTQDGPEPEDVATDPGTEGSEDPTEAIARLERALERIDRQGHPVAPGGGAAGLHVAEFAGRLDALIAQLRTALAERPGRE